jgi:hypothetical protein
MLETQEEIRGELALLAERVDGLAADRSAGRVELERQQNRLLEVAGGRKKRDTLLLGISLAALLLAIASLIVSAL